MKIDPENLGAALSIRDAITTLGEEIKHGGDQSPCPFCRVPRSTRIGYIRCHRCATNWMDGEMLDKDPRTERLQKFLTENRAMLKVKPKEEDAP